MNQDSIIRNQQVTNALARKASGLPENAPITERALEARRNDLAWPYREVSVLSPIARQALEKLREARAEAKLYWRDFDRNATPASQKEAAKWDQRAEIAERVIEQQAVRSGKPQLVNELRQARQQIAKTHCVERALNLADGNVDARILGRALERGAPLTDELATITQFSEAFPQLTRLGSGTPTPNVSALEAFASAGFGLGGSAAFGPGGLLLGGLPFARPVARNALLSSPGQRMLAQPSYGPAMQPEDPLLTLLRQATLAEQMK